MFLGFCMAIGSSTITLSYATCIRRAVYLFQLWEIKLVTITRQLRANFHKKAERSQRKIQTMLKNIASLYFTKQTYSYEYCPQLIDSPCPFFIGIYTTRVMF